MKPDLSSFDRETNIYNYSSYKSNRPSMPTLKFENQLILSVGLLMK